MESPRSDKKLLIGFEQYTPINENGQVSPGQISPGVYFPKRSRLGFTPRVRKRAILKNGDCNILQSRISKRRLRFLQDIFTTLVDTQWRWTLIVFALSFLLSWLGFAIIWWLIAFTHGDFEPEHLPANQTITGWTPCVSQLNSFTSCFLFSIETQHTIGYGSRATTEECPEAIFVMCLQSIAGVMIQAFMVGIVFAKMTRPKHRTQTLLFSKNAVICQRDGLLCLMFRVGDMRKSHIIGASIRAQLIRQKTTKEGELLNQYQTELTVSADGCDGDLFFIWPMTIVHKIDASSPLYHLSPRNFLNEQFEIVVILEGTIESTGQTTQARSSYIANEVLWGHRFEPVVCYSKDRRGYEVNYSKFDNVIEVDTPLCSGYELQNICINPIDTSSYIPKSLDAMSSISSISPANRIRQIPSEENLLTGEENEYDSDRGIVLHRPNESSSDSEEDVKRRKKERKDSTYETHV
ncbi:Inward rectifier potassium channel C-terminal domain [Popillia japonica]|uniref:Inward rectifier potassium channel C-terminal domain n=1 Tax=Popillia japonica TaxID=7064 RepID=A0AAW1JJE6_POPJA